MSTASIATQFDIDRMMAVMTTAFPADFNEAWNRRQLVDALVTGNCHYALWGADGTMADDNSEIAGFRLSRTGFEEEELLLIGVDPAHRRRGVGGAMLSSLAEDARKRGAMRLLLEMRRGNPAEALYRSFGFRPIGERREYYRSRDGTRVDAITFACAL